MALLYCLPLSYITYLITHNYHIFFWQLFATSGHKNFSTDALAMAKQFHNQKYYYRMHHRNIAKHYRNIKITSHHQNQYLLLYKPAEQFLSGLERFLECWKWCRLVINGHLGIFLIYMLASLGLQPSGLGIYIKQIPSAYVIIITYLLQAQINLV